MDKNEKFNSMKNKPELDRDTLNYIWDVLWRFNKATKPTNKDKRTRINEREIIMDYMQELANNNQLKHWNNQ